MSTVRSLSCVVPCYNEELSLPDLYRRVTDACKSAPVERYEIVLVNDGSRDATWSKISEFVRQDPHVIGIDLSRNHGHQLALSAGLSQVSGDAVFVIDADLQDPPELLSDMLQVMRDRKADVVYGVRRVRHGETYFKRASASAFYRLLGKLTDTRIPLDTGDFRLMSRRVVDVLNGMPEMHRFIRGLIGWIGFRQVPFLYDRDARKHGETKYPLRKMISFAVDAITGFSIAPLRVGVFFGLATGSLGLLLMAYTLISYFTHNAVPGWSSLMGSVLILGSMQMFMLGIIGEYLGRLFMQSKRRPLYIISEVLHAGSGGPTEESGRSSSKMSVAHVGLGVKAP